MKTNYSRVGQVIQRPFPMRFPLPPEPSIDNFPKILHFAKSIPLPTHKLPLINKAVLIVADSMTIFLGVDYLALEFLLNQKMEVCGEGLGEECVAIVFGYAVRMLL